MVVMPGWDNRKGHTPVPRDHGRRYKDSWKQVFTAKKKPKMIVINSFNEYAENTGVFTAKTDLYGDDPADMKKAGIEYAVNQAVDLMTYGVSGIHVYAMNKPELCEAIFEAVR